MDKERIWECPCCHYQITNTMLQRAVMDFQCRGSWTVSSPQRRLTCPYTLGDYKLKEKVNDEE